MQTLLFLCGVLIRHGVQANFTTAGVTTANFTTVEPSCRGNCGRNMGSCWCDTACQNAGDCCHDYSAHCNYTTSQPDQSTTTSSTEASHTTPDFTTVNFTTVEPSCRGNCGRNMGSCWCDTACQRMRDCCSDYSSHCNYTTSQPDQSNTTSSTEASHTTPDFTTDQPSCRYNCGRDMGNCSCRSNCRYYGNCCHNYNYYCPTTTTTRAPHIPTTAQPSCRYNCGYNMGNCSCSSSCQYYGNCCRDYHSFCYYPTTQPTKTTRRPALTTAQPSCRYNCGRHMGNCSCSSSCRYYGNCCHDYYSYCYVTAIPPTTVVPCGGSLFGSGTFSSPNHPNHYHNNAYCTWTLRAAYNQRVFLAFTYMELENNCAFDYINVYDGPSSSYNLLGKICYDSNLTSFYSTSTYMTVVFRSDSSVIARGFKAEFISALKPSSGKVSCTSDTMNIVIERSYLNSLGYSSHDLYLNDEHCRPKITSYQVIFSFPIESCGNVKQISSDRVVYTNGLRSSNSSSGEITRHAVLKLNVTCIMDQDSLSENMFVIQNPGNSAIIGTGKFNTTMTFYTSSSFYYPVTEFPYEVELNEYIYVQIDLKSSDNSLVIFLDTCVASPSPHDFQTRAYYFVRNGCTADNTYYAYYSGSRDYARFRVKTFQFLRASESVYLQCKVLVCQASDYNSRCRRGCTRRRARDLGSGHDSQTLVLGPIKLKESKKEEEGTGKQDQA